MRQGRGPGVRPPAMGGQGRRGSRRSRLRVFVGTALVLTLIGSSLLAWPPFSRPAITRAASGSISVSPGSGLAGTTVQLSGTGFPRQADLQGNVDAFTFNGNAITPFPTIIPCTDNTFGFGQACNANSPYPYQIPLGTQPGSYSFHMTISLPTGSVLVDSSTPFQVLAPATNTPTVTNTPSPTNTSQASAATPTTTATATKTPTGPTATAPPGATNTPTATATNTSQPNAPTATATNTAAPHAPTATATPTAVPTKKPLMPFVVLVRPEFNRDLLALALHTAPGAKIRIDLKITIVMADGSVRQVFGVTRNGVANARGLYSATLKIVYPAHKPGKASLTISETSGGATRTVKRTYPYRVYG